MAQHPAAYPHRVNKVTISGNCWDGAELWSTGFYVGTASADAGDPGTVTASAIATAWSAFFTHANSKVSNAYKTLQVKVSQLETDGDVDLDMIDIYDYPAAITGAFAGSPMPPQISLAATMTSDTQRGLASKGRMYLPGVAASISNTDPKIGSVDQGNIADRLKIFFDAVNASSAVAGDIILASKGHKFTVLQDPNNWYYVNGVIAKVTGVRVGDVYDTQRRRRDGLDEIYVSRVLA
jgi:hypothetical protein